MTDTFASLISPVFQVVIDLQQRLEQGENPALGPVREQIVVALDEAERKAAVSSQVAHDFALAKHALVYWIDEILINSPWKHATEWRQHILEWDLFQERLRADRFYEMAHEAEVLANTDPLGNGWFFKVHVTDMGEFDQLMDGPAYDLLVKNS